MAHRDGMGRSRRQRNLQTRLINAIRATIEAEGLLVLAKARNLKHETVSRRERTAKSAYRRLNHVITEVVLLTPEKAP